MSEEKQPGALPSWWPKDDTPAAKAPDPAAAPAPPRPAEPANPAAAAHIANQMPSWWKPEFQTAAKFSTPEAPSGVPPPAVEPPPPPPPAPEPPTQAAPVAAAAPPPPPPAAPAPPPPQSAPPAKTMVLPAAQVAPPVAILTVTAGPDTGFKFRIKPSAIAMIGRDPESDVVLNDPATSRRHAHIEFKDGKYVLTDLGSANGTLVNDQRVKERVLSDGDVIKIGQNVLGASIKPLR